jgi:serine/threonine-protein kinase
LEQALLVYVGPIASQLVKKYARQYHDIDSLLDALSTHIPNQREETQFRSAVNASGLTLITGANLQTHSSGAADRAAASPAVTLTEEQHQQIGRLLAQFIGPLASRIVAREQQAAVSPTDFRNRLAESISKQTERVEFLKKLERLLQDWSRIV